MDFFEHFIKSIAVQGWPFAQPHGKQHDLKEVNFTNPSYMTDKRIMAGHMN